jgi:hypothetical protein
MRVKGWWFESPILRQIISFKEEYYFRQRFKEVPVENYIQSFLSTPILADVRHKRILEKTPNQRDSTASV